VEICDSNPGGSPVKPQPTLLWLREPTEVGQEEASALALKFSQQGCASSRLVGGKGCQLALLIQLMSDVRHYATFLIHPFIDLSVTFILDKCPYLRLQMKEEKI